MECVEGISAIAFYQDMLIHIGLPNSSHLLDIIAVYFKNCKRNIRVKQQL